MADENVKIDTPPLANMWGESLLRAAWIYLQNDPICGLPLSEAQNATCSFRRLN